jgi:uncharacterized protein (TIGR03083 family)
VDRDECWKVIAEHRRGLADLLEDLTEDQWDHPSLCSEWRVRDVVAHVAMTPKPPGLASMVAGAVRVRGDFDRLNRDFALQYAGTTPAELIAQLREHADSRRRVIITSYRNLLFDVLVHIQDIAVPLGRTQVMPLAAARVGVERVWSMGWPFWAERKLRGLRLTATDTDWSAGAGAEVRGPTKDLLLLLTGRTAAALPQLSGPGTERLIARQPQP